MSFWGSGGKGKDAALCGGGGGGNEQDVFQYIVVPVRRQAD